MFESDADRLAMLKSLGGLSLRARGKDFVGIFDSATKDLLNLVESREPQLLCRSIDVDSIEIQKEDQIEISGEQYRVKKIEPDGTGMTVLVLKR